MPASNQRRPQVLVIQTQTRACSWLALGLLALAGVQCSGSDGKSGAAVASGGGAGSAGTANGSAGNNAGSAGSSTAGGGSPSAGAAASFGGAGGGAGGSGGAVGSGGSGASLTGGASLCASKQYLLCEGFESTAEGAIPTGWTKKGTIAVAADQAARGTHALKVGNAESGERRIAQSALSFGTNHWGRLFYRVAQPVPTVNPSKNNGNTVIHSTLVGLAATRPLGGTAEYRVLDTIMNQARDHDYIFNVQTSTAGEYGFETSYTYQYVDSWTCAEWHVDNVAKSYHLFIDGVAISSIDVQNDQSVAQGTAAGLPTDFTTINLGWYNYQAGDGGFTAWIDELAIDTSRIGCDG